VCGRRVAARYKIRTPAPYATPEIGLRPVSGASSEALPRRLANLLLAEEKQLSYNANTMKNIVKKALIVAAIASLVLIAALSLYSNRYYYTHAGYAGHTVIRINRITGRADMLDFTDGWTRLGPPPPARISKPPRRATISLEEFARTGFPKRASH
jgi:hypothetical protein